MLSIHGQIKKNVIKVAPPKFVTDQPAQSLSIDDLSLSAETRQYVPSNVDLAIFIGCL